MESISNRKFLAWVQWFKDQWNNPSLTHYYLMQLSRDVRRCLAKNPNAITSEQSRLQFEMKPKLTSKEERAAAGERSRRTWMGFLNASFKLTQDQNRQNK